MKRYLCLVIFLLFFSFLFILFTLPATEVKAQEGIEAKETVTYKNNNMTIEFKIKEITIGQATLKSHKTYDEVLKITSGKNRAVVWYEFSDFKDIQLNALKEVEFIDMWEEITNESYIKEFDENIELINESKTMILNPNYLKPVNKTYHFVYQNEKGDWLLYNSLDIPKENITIGVQTDLFWGEFLDVRFNIFGNKLDRHALVLGTNCGFVTEAPTDDPQGTTTGIDNYALATRDTSPATAAKVTEIGWYCTGAGDESNFEVAIYTHDNTNNKPNAIVGVSRTNAKGTTAGWKAVTGLDIEISPSTIYWIAVQLDDTTVTTNTDRGNVGDARNYFSGQSTLPDPWNNGGTTSTGSSYAFYAVWEEVADSTPPEVSIQSPTNTTYTSNPVNFNVTLNEAGSWCGYSLNGTANATMLNLTGDWEASETLGNSAYNVKFCCNDTSGNMNGTESVSFTVSVVALQNYSRNMSDSMQPLDISSKRSAWERLYSDKLTASESYKRVYGLEEELTDSAQSSDTCEKKYGLKEGLTDLAQSSDASEKTYEFNRFFASTFQSISTLRVVAIEFFRTTSEFLQSASLHTILKSLSRSVTDSATAQAILSSSEALRRFVYSVSQTVINTEKWASFFKGVSDAAQSFDANAAFRGLQRQFTDSMTASTVGEFFRALSRSFASTMQALDSITHMADLITLQEYARMVYDALQSAVQTIKFYELRKILYDAITSVDIHSILQGIRQNVYDSATVQSLLEAYRELSRRFASIMQAADSSLWISEFRRAMDDALQSIVQTVKSYELKRIFHDALTLTDIHSILQGIRQNVYDSMTVQSFLEFYRELSRSFASAMQIIDSSLRVSEFKRMADDFIQALDNLTGVSEFLRRISSAAQGIDIVTAFKGLVRAVYTSVTNVDIVGVWESLSRSVYSSFTMQLLIAIRTSLERIFYSSVQLIDTITHTVGRPLHEYVRYAYDSITSSITAHAFESMIEYLYETVFVKTLVYIARVIETEYEIAAAGFVSGGAIIFIWLSFSISERHRPLQILYFFIGLSLLVNGLAIGRSVAIRESAPSGAIALTETSITVSTWALYIALAYFFIHFLYNILMSMLPEKYRRRIKW